jgi:hypothetical protein
MIMDLCYVHESGSTSFKVEDVDKSPILELYSATAIVVNNDELDKLRTELIKTKKKFAKYDIDYQELHPRKICYADKPFDKLLEKNQNLRLMREIGEAIADSGVKLIARVVYPISKTFSRKGKKDFRLTTLYPEMIECVTKYVSKNRKFDTPFYAICPGQLVKKPLRWNLLGLWEKAKRSGLSGFQGLIVDDTQQVGEKQKDKQFPWHKDFPEYLVDSTKSLFLGTGFLALREAAHYVAYVARGNRARGDVDRYKWYEKWYNILLPSFIKKADCGVNGDDDIQLS